MWESNDYSVMHPCGHQSVRAVILLWLALHPATRRGGVMTWHCREKSRHNFFFFWGDSCKNIIRMSEYGKRFCWEHMVRFPNWGGVMELKCMEEMAIWYDWSTTGDPVLGVRDQQQNLMEWVVIYVLLKGEGKLPNGLHGEISTFTVCGSWWPGVIDSDSKLMSKGWLVIKIIRIYFHYIIVVDKYSYRFLAVWLSISIYVHGWTTVSSTFPS